MTNENPNLSGTDLSPLQRKKLVHALRVKIPTHQRALRTLQSCLEGSSYSAEPKSLFIGGDSGMGKSTLIEAFEMQYPRLPSEEADHIPVLVASIPSAATTKGTVSGLLKKLGDPKAFNGELSKLTDRLLTYLEACEVKMIVLDEFQHIIDRESSRLRAGTADWLKTVVNEAKIPLALVGLPYSEVILDENIQLDRRFHRRIFLERFAYSAKDERAAFRVLVKLIDDHLPFPVSAGLDEPRLAEWLFNRSKGLLGPLMSIIRDAAEMAIDEGAMQINPEYLDQAYLDNRSAILRLEEEQDAVKRRRGRPRKGPSLGDLLRP